MTTAYIVKEKYYTHKYGASKRGIPFLLTFYEWRRCWRAALGPKWLEKRGNRRGKYVMARKGDKGPYAIWNIEIILHEENTRVMRKNGSLVIGQDRVQAKLDEKQVLEIFHANGSYRKIAAKYGMYFGTVYDIKAGRSWKHVTAPLRITS